MRCSLTLVLHFDEVATMLNGLHRLWLKWDNRKPNNRFYRDEMLPSRKPVGFHKKDHTQWRRWWPEDIHHSVTMMEWNERTKNLPLTWFRQEPYYWVHCFSPANAEWISLKTWFPHHFSLMTVDVPGILPVANSSVPSMFPTRITTNYLPYHWYRSQILLLDFTILTKLYSYCFWIVFSSSVL